jgi:hypothetical protein
LFVLSLQEKTAEGADVAASKPAEAPAQASWGGKASFANVRPPSPQRTSQLLLTLLHLRGCHHAQILKLNAEAEAFQPTAPAASPVKAAAPAASTTAPVGNGERRQKTSSTGSSSAPVKPTASAVAAASKRDSSKSAATTTDASGEWSTSTGKSRSSRDAANGRDHKDKEGARPSAGSGSTSTSGANAKGVWAKETLPALPEEKK